MRKKKKNKRRKEEEEEGRSKRKEKEMKEEEKRRKRRNKEIRMKFKKKWKKKRRRRKRKRMRKKKKNKRTKEEEEEEEKKNNQKNVFKLMTHIPIVIIRLVTIPVCEINRRAISPPELAVVEGVAEADVDLVVDALHLGDEECWRGMECHTENTECNHQSVPRIGC